MRQTSIAFQSDGLTLEGVVGWPERAPGRVPVVVVCPPHPTLSGDMEHPLVERLCRALDRSGIATVRFNYRGISRSEGDFTNGEREIEDVAAALKVARRWPGCDGKWVGLVAYSFGASVVLRGLERLKGVKALALISPPPMAASESIGKVRKQHLLVLAGGVDRIAPADRLREIVETSRASAQVQVVSDASHTWEGLETEVSERAAGFLAGALG